MSRMFAANDSSSLLSAEALLAPPRRYWHGRCTDALANGDAVGATAGSRRSRDEPPWVCPCPLPRPSRHAVLTHDENDRGLALITPPAPSGGPRQVPVRWNREALGPGCHLRHFSAGRARERIRRARSRGARPRRDPGERLQRRPNLHRASALAAGRGLPLWAARLGRPALGAARDLPRRPDPARLHRTARRRRC